MAGWLAERLGGRLSDCWDGSRCGLFASCLGSGLAMGTCSLLVPLLSVMFHVKCVHHLSIRLFKFKGVPMKKSTFCCCCCRHVAGLACNRRSGGRVGAEPQAGVGCG